MIVDRASSFWALTGGEPRAEASVSSVVDGTATLHVTNSKFTLDPTFVFKGNWILIYKDLIMKTSKYFSF